MIRGPLSRLVLIVALARAAGGSRLVAAASVVPSIDDPGRLVVGDAAWASTLQAKLDAFAHRTGIILVLQFHAQSPPANEDRVAGAYMSALSRKLGLIQQGVLVVYFADDPDWRVWVGNDLTPRFVGQPGNAESLTKSGAMHRAKEAVLQAAKARADAEFAARKNADSGPGDSSPREHLALWATALVDGLCSRLGPE